MLKQDFNRIKEISKELNEIRLRNNLTELQLKADNKSFISEKYNNVMLLTREENTKACIKKYIERCRISRMRWNLTTKEFEDMDYNEYINFR